MLGAPPMPHQELIYDVGLEINPETGLLAYRELVVTMMRQHGKSTTVLTLEVERALMWGDDQRIAYTAQTGWDARRKLLEDHAPMLTRSRLGNAVKRVLRGAGSEAIVFNNRSRIDVMASSAAAGHGRTLDQGIIDEAFDDLDDRREQAILPAMMTKPNGQLIVVSTAGTDASLYLKRKVNAGRHAVTRNSGEGIAYIEYSIPDDADIDDPEVWWACMPALGYTITPAVVAHARQSMGEGEFRRGFGNQWTKDDAVRLIPDTVWAPVCDPSARPDGRLRFGLAVLPDQSATAIVSCGANNVIEVIEHRPGTSWAPERAAELVEKWDGVIVVDGGGPAVAVANDLERSGVPVERLRGGDVVASCMAMFNAIADRQVIFRPHEAMDAAVEGLAKKDLGDRFVWSFSLSRSDITPFYAATLAYQPGAAEVEPWVAYL